MSDPFKDIIKAARDATRKAQNLPTQRTIGARAAKIGPQPGRVQTNAEKVADFATAGGTGKVINAIDRARLGDYSGMLSQAGGAVKTAGIQALFPEGMGVGKSAATKFLGSLGKEATMTMADLPERYAIMTAENPGGIMGAPGVAGGNPQLAADARALGKKVTPVLGSYTDDKTGEKLLENSYLIHDIGQTDAAALAAKHGQNSFVSQRGLHDIGSGKIYPSKGISEATGDTYTELPGGQRMVHNLDWDNPIHPAPSHSAAMVKRLMSQGPIFGAQDLEAAKAGDALGHGTGPELPPAAADSVVKKGVMRLPAVQAPNGDIFPAGNHGDAAEMAQSYGHKEADLKYGHMTRDGMFGDRKFTPLNNPAADSVVARAGNIAFGRATMPYILNGQPNKFQRFMGNLRTGTVQQMVNGEDSFPQRVKGAFGELFKGPEGEASAVPKASGAAGPSTLADSAVTRAARSIAAPNIILPKPTKEVIGSAFPYTPEEAAARIAAGKSLADRPTPLTPSQVKARGKAAWAAANAPVPAEQIMPKAKGILVDRSGIAPDAGPSTEPLPTREAAGKGATGQVRGINSDQQIALNRAFMQRGLKMKWPTFYSSYPAWGDALANAGGDPDLWHKATTASAIQNGVNGEIQNASAIINATHAGVTDLNEIKGATTQAQNRDIALKIRNHYNANKPEGTTDLFLTGGHVQAFGKMLRGEPAGNAYKIPLYGDQKLGNVPGAVLDTHMSRTGTVFSPHTDYFSGNKGFSNKEYAYPEAANREAAASLGLSDRGGQESQWSGGGVFSGLKSAPNEDYAQIAENQFLRHANLTGQSPQAAMRNLATGRQALFTPTVANANQSVFNLKGIDY